MALRSTCACMYTASNSAESALTYEYLTRNYLSCNLDIVRHAYTHHSFKTELQDCRDPDKLLQVYREYMQFGVLDLRKNKKFADITDIQKHYMLILSQDQYIFRCLCDVGSLYCLRQLFISEQTKPRHERKLTVMYGIRCAVRAYRRRLLLFIYDSCSDLERWKTFEREVNAINPSTF